ncbi:spore gernimation protein [Paenibacillus psychroresistens]|uniref:Spore gernimation protein n=1 Tax=Paenibacillus psychroresistens TaxID=1778678 RepID=A0A6B8RR68_9BACL|nr:endospore germination permease [Paenibacillus psychroresistens]QGQ97886.1 spore gernimation protein [Paenibacillus psychroresistens]
MVENGKISILQFGIMMFMFAIGSAVILIPSIIVAVAKQDAWITFVIAIGLDFGIVTFWTALAKRFPNETIIQYSERILGKWFGKMIGLIYISYFLYLSALVLRNLGDFISTSLLVQTPQQFVHIIFMIPIMYGAYLGLEVIGRASEILLPWVVLFFLVMTILLLKDIDFSKLLPILPNGIQMPIKGLYPLIGFPKCEMILFLMLTPFVKQPGKIKKYFLLFFIGSAVFAALLVLVSITVLGVDLTERSTFSVFDLAKEIKVGSFFNRVEVLVGGIWIITIFVKLCLCFYAANLATAYVFNLKSYRITILPYGLIVIALSTIVFHNPAEAFWFITGAYPLYAMFHGFFIPGVLLVVAKIRKLKIKPKEVA